MAKVGANWPGDWQVSDEECKKAALRSAPLAGDL
jgi:hypothetical protein